MIQPIITCFYILLTGYTFFACKDYLNKQIHVKEDGTFEFHSGDLKMQVNPLHGARITSFSLKGKEALYQGDPGKDNFGATFLPSPQCFWTWPPPPIINRMPYQVIKKKGSLVFISQKDTITGLVAGKEIIPGKNQDNYMDVKYFFINKNDTVFPVAPWQNTRFMKGGLFLFPTGKEINRRKLFDPLPLEKLKNYTWYQDNNKLPKDHRLSVNDGRGWLAYFHRGLILVQEFEDIDPTSFAPGEGEVESYLSPVFPFIELECQGAYQPISPGDTLKWRVRWRLIEVNRKLNNKPGSLSLAKIVENEIK